MSQSEKENAYMSTGSEMKSAIKDYVSAAQDIGISDQSIANDVRDALEESNIKITDASID